MDLMEQIRLDAEKRCAKFSPHPKSMKCDCGWCVGRRDGESLFSAGAQALLNLLGRSATSEGHPPRVWIFIYRDEQENEFIEADRKQFGKKDEEQYLSKIEHQALRAADLLEIERLKQRLSEVGKISDILQNERNRLARLVDGKNEELSEEREARKGDSAELERLKKEVVAIRDQLARMCSKDIQTIRATHLKMLEAERSRNARLTAALEKIAGYSPSKGLVKAMPMRAIQEMHAIALEALDEAGKPEEPHPKGFCNKCGLSLRGREDFPLSCTCAK